MHAYVAMLSHEIFLGKSPHVQEEPEPSVGSILRAN